MRLLISVFLLTSTPVLAQTPWVEGNLFEEKSCEWAIGYYYHYISQCGPNEPADAFCRTPGWETMIWKKGYGIVGASERAGCAQPGHAPVYSAPSEIDPQTYTYFEDPYAAADVVPLDPVSAVFKDETHWPKNDSWSWGSSTGVR